MSFALVVLALLTAGPRGPCEKLLRADAGEPSTVKDWLQLTECSADAGQLERSAAAAHRVVALEAVPAAKEFPLGDLEHAALQLDRAGVDLEIPAPGSCAELPKAPGCAKSFLACTQELSGIDRLSETAYYRLEINAALTAKSARLFDDHGDEPTWGQPFHFIRPWMCNWRETFPKFWIDQDDHATVVLRSQFERTCLPDHVACRVEDTDAGPGFVASLECRLVLADACHQLLGTVCVVRQLRSDPKHLGDRRVTLKRIQP